MPVLSSVMRTRAWAWQPLDRVSQDGKRFLSQDEKAGQGDVAVGVQGGYSVLCSTLAKVTCVALLYTVLCELITRCF